MHHRWVFTDHRHGDLQIDLDPDALEDRRARIAATPWTWLRQVHGAEVVTVAAPGDGAGARADAAVTAAAGSVLAVHTADCAPVLLRGPGTLGVVHAGWRGLEAGVIEAAVEAMADLGGAPVDAVLGPCIEGTCYEFGEADAAGLVARYGPEVRCQTTAGRPGLDVPAAVAAACAEMGVPLRRTGGCTACSSTHWSHRARGDRGRQALVAWLEPGEAVTGPPVVQG